MSMRTTIVAALDAWAGRYEGDIAPGTPEQMADAYRAEVLHESAEVAVRAARSSGDDERGQYVASVLAGVAKELRRMAGAGKDTREGESTQPAAGPNGCPFCTNSTNPDLRDHVRNVHPNQFLPWAGAPSTATDFFRPGRTYTDGNGYRAPEITTTFRVEHVTRHPDRGHLRAIGWMKSGTPNAPWHGHFQDEGEFEGWTEVAAAGEVR